MRRWILRDCSIQTDLLPMRRWSLLIQVLATAIGCTSHPRHSVADTRSTSLLPGVAEKTESVAVRASMSTPLPAISPHSLQWNADGVAEHLRSDGLAVRIDPKVVVEPFLHPAGARMIVYSGSKDSAEVLAFFYGGAIEAGRDVEALDTETVGPKNVSVSWRAPAALVTDNNLVAIVLSRDAQLRRRIGAALRVSGGR